MEKVKKGLSPVIATVLLIGMVIVLGLIIFLWFRSFTEEVITKFDDENIKLACERVSFQAEQIGSTISIFNDGNVPIYRFNVKEITEEGYNTNDILEYEGWPTLGLNPGESFSSNSFDLDKEYTLTPILLGKAESGDKTYVCDSKYEEEV